MTKKITLGQLITGNDINGKEFPMIDVVVNGVDSGYISPRKGTSFQILANDGRCTLGRSINDEYHIKDYLTYPEKDNSLLKAFVLTTVMEYGAVLKEMYDSCEDDECDIIIDIDYHGEDFRQFIELSRTYIRSYK